jgi:hypothetical protein
MIKNIGLAVLFVALILSYGFRGMRECSKPTPRWEGNCIIQGSQGREVKTCG